MFTRILDTQSMFTHIWGFVMFTHMKSLLYLVDCTLRFVDQPLRLREKNKKDNRSLETLPTAWYRFPGQTDIKAFRDILLLFIDLSFKNGNEKTTYKIKNLDFTPVFT